MSTDTTNKDEFIYHDGFQFYGTENLAVSISDKGCKISFGSERMDGTKHMHSGVFMAPTMLKVLSEILNNAIKSHEETTGNKIPFDKAVLEGISTEKK